MTEDKLNINIKIGERKYPLKIDRQDEEKIRKAAGLLNSRMLKYKQNIAGKDDFDYLSMAALQFVIESVDNNFDTWIDNFKNEIKQINSDIDVYLCNQQE